MQMRFRLTALTIVVVGTMLGLAGPAQANHAPTPASDAPPRTHDARCPTCVVPVVAPVVVVLAPRLVPAVIAGARALKAARAARKLRAAGRALKAAPKKGVNITPGRVRTLRNEARTIARRGKGWVQRNWPKFKPYVRACLATVASLEATEYLEDGKLNELEWNNWINLGNWTGKPDLIDLHVNPAFDFNVKTDGWAAACAVGIIAKGVGG